MDKTLFSILLPATGDSYEMWIPNELTVYEATELVRNILGETQEKYFEPTQGTSLFYLQDGGELLVDKRIEELSLPNGTKLMLV